MYLSYMLKMKTIFAVFPSEEIYDLILEQECCENEHKQETFTVNFKFVKWFYSDSFSGVALAYSSISVYEDYDTLHVIQNAKTVESASDLENADVHLGMEVDTVIKQFVLKVVGIMELVWLLGFVAVQLDGSVEHVT
ncbi:hypothetical protein BTVI_62276 [Pitangus sulphuratus]|nr:hypothetical protein BTVI_62276 [Pitangus sulphuratus]